MKIIQKEETSFNLLSCGECFKIGTKFYIKSHDGTNYVGIRLDNGKREMITQSNVIPVEAEIIIK